MQKFTSKIFYSQDGGELGGINKFDIPMIKIMYKSIIIIMLTFFQEVSIPGSNMTIALVFIDTIILAGTSDPKDMFSSPDGPDSQQAADDEWEWIDQTLAGYSKPEIGRASCRERV